MVFVLRRYKNVTAHILIKMGAEGMILRLERKDVQGKAKIKKRGRACCPTSLIKRRDCSARTAAPRGTIEGASHFLEAVHRC